MATTSHRHSFSHIQLMALFCPIGLSDLIGLNSDAIGGFADNSGAGGDGTKGCASDFFFRFDFLNSRPPIPQKIVLHFCVKYIISSLTSANEEL